MGIRGRRSGTLRIIAAVATVALLATTALVLFQAQNRARRELENRFALRTSIAGSFISAWVDDFARREAIGAEPLLQDSKPARKDFEEFVLSQQLKAAVLLDENGLLLQVWPRNPELLGTNLAAEYPHLDQALQGRQAVSNVVPSAAEGIPIVAVAVPIKTPFGRRVFSGAFEVANTPIGRSYLSNVSPIAGSRVYLVDALGKPLSTNLESPDRVLERDRDLFRRLSNGLSTTTVIGEDIAGVERIEGTPWRIAVVTPKAQLFAPISGWTMWAPWLSFAGLVGAAAGAWWLFEKLRRNRFALAEVNSSLVERNAEIQESAAAQRRFISAASHELRTPLTSILGYLELTRDASDDDEKETALQVVERNAKRLYGLVDDLMLVFRSEVEAFARDEVDIYEIFAHSRDSLSPAAAERGIELELRGSPPLTVLGDRERLGQVADNLISNAIKYSLEGGRVEVFVGAHGTTVRAEVVDNGIGVPADELGRMFERFFRASTARQARIGGTGLGLAISRAIVERHGGRIGISSVEGKGTTFVVELPLVEGG
ncbi:MAG: sensor histidine kinase [Actinomycetota bacterium]|nr:sensor histidine kinase [Actinomycetota bacterium]